MQSQIIKERICRESWSPKRNMKLKKKKIDETSLAVVHEILNIEDILTFLTVSVLPWLKQMLILWHKVWGICHMRKRIPIQTPLYIFWSIKQNVESIVIQQYDLFSFLAYFLFLIIALKNWMCWLLLSNICHRFHQFVIQYTFHILPNIVQSFSRSTHDFWYC